MQNKPNYGTWIRKKKLYAFEALAIVFIGLTAFSFLHLIFIIAAIPAVLFGYIAVILILTSYRFSAKGGDYQNKIHGLIIRRTSEKKEILDIGCGNGNLAIKLAKTFPKSGVIGLDYWDKEWEYTASVCENNARLENAPNTRFIRGSASKLPFENGSLDCTVSCLTFHEVRDVKEKEYCLAEAIRVLKPNGRFVFLDLFDDPKHYPEREKYRETIIRHGGMIDEDKAVHEILNLPFPLDKKQSLRYARIITGIKNGPTPAARGG